MNDLRFPLEVAPNGSFVQDVTEVERNLSLVKAICSTFIGEHPIETRMGISDAVLGNVTPSELVSSVENSLAEYVDFPYEVFASIGEGETSIQVLYDGSEVSIPIPRN